MGLAAVVADPKKDVEKDRDSLGPVDCSGSIWLWALPL